MRIAFSFRDAANKLISSKTLLRIYNLEFYIPKFAVFRQGVIRIDQEYTNEYLKERIRQSDFHCKFEVESVRRINKKIIENNETKYNPTRTVIISFKTQELPKYISVNHVRFAVEPYVQRVILCNNCCQFGQMSTQCRSKTRYLKCGGNHSAETCKGNHFTNQIKDCPEFKRQKKVKQYMAHSNVSYREAIKFVPKITYASDQ